MMAGHGRNAARQGYYASGKTAQDAHNDLQKRFPNWTFDLDTTWALYPGHDA